MSEETALKDFLRKQARSLDSLLELTPAKNMFGEDVSDQWQRKKQTPEQKKAARMAKLDPANWKSAKDVYDERSAEAAKKRKREQEGQDESEEPSEQQGQPSKKQKSHANDATPKSKPVPTEKLTERIESDQLQNKNLKKKMKKRAHRSEKNQQKREQQEERKINPPTEVIQSATNNDKTALPEQSKPKKKGPQSKKLQAEGASPVASKDVKKPKEKVKPANTTPEDLQQDNNAEDEDDEQDADDDEGAWSDVEDEEVSKVGQTESHSHDMVDDDKDEDTEMVDAESTATSSEGVSEILSPPQDSAASSVSSIVPPQIQPTKSTQQADVKSNEPQLAPPANTAQTDAERQAARERLQEQISQFRSQRKADDKPVRSRAELLAQRRQKEQERKAAKKEQRRKEKEDEAKRQDEEMAKRFSPGGSGSLLASPRSPMIDDGGSNAFTFGRIAFEDGTAFDAATGSAAANKKHKGPADPATALKAAQAKQARVAGLDDEKKQSIEEKDMWLNAKKKAHGERVKDDTSLLKKALKRQEKQKQKSGKDWDARVEGVRSSQEAKQKKRTENLQKRKDEKGAKKTGKKKVKRPGFEGSFRGRAGKSKKS
ncbi:hypothetical protein OHC33_000798 [Knufia fluminis]|uniref:SURF6-domain-containing protein n=1 Tax=Knufia fluminis TaxID=191047 RepID=A0AAN8FFK1_9EURO|nr:hypothetical protein OHC33_000798 [Knufia fluminis]